MHLRSRCSRQGLRQRRPATAPAIETLEQYARQSQPASPDRRDLEELRARADPVRHRISDGGSYVVRTGSQNAQVHRIHQSACARLLILTVIECDRYGSLELTDNPRIVRGEDGQFEVRRLTAARILRELKDRWRR